MNESTAPEEVVVVRGHNVRDHAGNAYGVLDIHPDPPDVAVLLGLRSATTGELGQAVLRPGVSVDRLGLRLRCTAIDCTAPERVTLLVEPVAGVSS